MAKPSILFLEHVEYLHGAHQERPGPDPVVTNFYKELWREDENKGIIIDMQIGDHFKRFIVFSGYFIVKKIYLIVIL